MLEWMCEYSLVAFVTTVAQYPINHSFKSIRLHTLLPSSSLTSNPLSIKLPEIQLFDI